MKKTNRPVKRGGDYFSRRRVNLPQADPVVLPPSRHPSSQPASTVLVLTILLVRNLLKDGPLARYRRREGEGVQAHAVVGQDGEWGSSFGGV